MCVAVGASRLYWFVCVRALCANKNTELYSWKPGFWLLKNSFFFFV